MSKEQVYYDVLKRISKYMTPDQIRKDAGGPLSYSEYLEMSYENMQADAAHAIKGHRRPKE